LSETIILLLSVNSARRQ